MTSLNCLGMRKSDINGFPCNYPEDCYISIYQINYKLLIEKLNLLEINNRIGYEYDQNFAFKTNINFNRKNVHIGIDIDPIDKTNHNNFN